MSTPGGWRHGDPVAWRSFADLGPVDLELGGHLPGVRVAYETWGEFDGDNAILVQHALTGDAHAVGPAGLGQPTPGWWDDVIGPGKAVDTNRWFVVSANVLGGCQGTTGPSSLAPNGQPWGSRFPRITIRDQVKVEARLADALGIDRWASIMGGSMGGMRTLEWLVMYPDRVGSAAVLATSAHATADQIATQTAQILAIQSDPAWQGGDYYQPAANSVISPPPMSAKSRNLVGPVAGLGVARRIAHLTYRTERELDMRFGRRPQPGEDPLADGRFAVQSYLDHHADKLAQRFDAGTYVALSDAMSLHDVYRGRDPKALSGITVPLRVAGISSDRLYPLYLQQQIADEAGVSLDVIDSPFGHDGFLIEAEAVGKIVSGLLDDLQTRV